MGNSPSPAQEGGKREKDGNTISQKKKKKKKELIQFSFSLFENP